MMDKHCGLRFVVGIERNEGFKIDIRKADRVRCIIMTNCDQAKMNQIVIFVLEGKYNNSYIQFFTGAFKKK